MESRLRLLVVLSGLPEPVTQHPVQTLRGVYRLDLAWPSVRVALEYDGRHHVGAGRYFHERCRWHCGCRFCG
jgi:very-short-patch-repair endonuclease